jgi:hypothetical protein
MEYLIHHRYIDAPSGKRVIGVEIQPPLDETGASGVVKELMARPEGSNVNGTEHIADDVTITRNNKEGTALLISPNARRGPVVRSEEAAHALACLIDPCNTQQIEFQPPLV